MPKSSPQILYTFTFHIGIIHGHSLFQCATHRWHFDTGNNMTESKLLITQIKYSRVAAQGSDFMRGLAHYTQVSFNVGAQQCIGVMLNGNCNVFFDCATTPKSTVWDDASCMHVLPSLTKDFQETLQQPPCTSKPIYSGRRKPDKLLSRIRDQ